LPNAHADRGVENICSPLFYWNKYKIFLDKLKPTFIIINMNKLNEILYQKRITKAELARKLKISPQRVNNWTCGNNYPNRKYTKLIAEYLDVSIEKLFYDEEENK
jgi:DNA-binding XRE family transcriptional regulator